jgi:putative transcriptional regulator
MQKKFVFDLRVVGKRIKKARKTLKLTQEEIAGKVDISGQYWSMVETGRYGGSVNTYLQIAAALGLTLNDLFYDEAELICATKEFNMDGWLSDCDEFEKAVLLDFLLAMKPILKKRREMIEL